MKTIKKVLASLLAIATLSTYICAVPTSADIVIDNSVYTEGTMGDYKGGSTYTLPQDFSIRDVIEDENHTIVINGKSFVLKSISSNPNNGPTVMYFLDGELLYNDDESDLKILDASFIDDEGFFWYYIAPISKEDELNKENKLLTKSLLLGATAPTDTIGDSESNTSNEITLGDSPTGIRGDIDYDGDVDAVDLLLLKKYLLQMITW